MAESLFLSCLQTLQPQKEPLQGTLLYFWVKVLSCKTFSFSSQGLLWPSSWSTCLYFYIDYVSGITHIGVCNSLNKEESLAWNRGLHNNYSLSGDIIESNSHHENRSINEEQVAFFSVGLNPSSYYVIWGGFTKRDSRQEIKTQDDKMAERHTLKRESQGLLILSHFLTCPVYLHFAKSLCENKSLMFLLCRNDLWRLFRSSFLT